MKGDLEIVVAGTADGFTMVEGGSKEVSEEVMMGALAMLRNYHRDVQTSDELKKLAGKINFPLAPLQVSLENKEAMLAEAMPQMEKPALLKENIFVTMLPLR